MTFGFLLASSRPLRIWNPTKSRRTTNASRKKRFNGDGEGGEKRESVVRSGEVAREESDESAEDSSRVFSSAPATSSQSLSSVSSPAVEREGFSLSVMVQVSGFASGWDRNIHHARAEIE